MLERVEDEVEAVCERGREVVAVLGDVPGDDLGEIRKLIGEIAQPALFRQLGVLPVSLA